MLSITSMLGTGGAWKVIDSRNVTSTVASVDFTTGIDSTYRTYAVHWEGVVGDTNIDSLRVAFGDSSGFDTGASDYKDTGYWMYDGAGFAATGNANADSYIDLQSLYSGTVAGSSLFGQATFSRPTDGVSFPIFDWHGGNFSHSSETRMASGCGIRQAAITVDRLRFIFYTGTIIRGRFTLYGIGHA